MTDQDDDNLEFSLIAAMQRAEKAAKSAQKAAKKAKEAVKQVEKTKDKIKTSKKKIKALQRMSDEKRARMEHEIMDIVSKAVKKEKALKKIAKRNLEKKQKNKKET